MFTLDSHTQERIHQSNYLRAWEINIVPFLQIFLNLFFYVGMTMKSYTIPWKFHGIIK